LPDTLATAIDRWGKYMENANQQSEVPVSNWTLATGTRPGERQISIRLRSKTRRVRPRRKVVAAEHS